MGYKPGWDFLPDELRQKRWCYIAELVCINNYIKKVKKNGMLSGTATFIAILMISTCR
jgi:hypothetical protein